MSNNENDIIYIQNNSSPNSVIVQPHIISNNIDVEIIQNFHYISTEVSQENNIDILVANHSISVDIIDNRILYNIQTNVDPTYRNIKKVYSSYTVSTDDDIILIYPTSSNIEITLPSAVLYTNKTLTFKKRIGTYSAQILPIANQTIDDENTVNLLYNNESITIISDNNNWCII